MNERPYSLYRLTFPDGLMYFGITKQIPSKRWANGKGYAGQNKIYNAIRQYGWENIKKDVIRQDLSEQEALAYETVCIRYFNTVDHGYNTTKDTCDLSGLVDCLCACLVSTVKQLRMLEHFNDNLWKLYQDLAGSKEIKNDQTD